MCGKIELGTSIHIKWQGELDYEMNEMKAERLVSLVIDNQRFEQRVCELEG